MSSALAFDAEVDRLVRANVGRAAAIAHVRKTMPYLAAEKDAAEQKRADVLEKEEQREIIKLFTAFRFRVRTLSQPRATKQSPGLFDLWLTHRDLPIAAWWDSKRQIGGKVSAAQLEFLDDCTRCGIRAGFGDRHAARTFLIALGLATVINGSLEPVR